MIKGILFDKDGTLVDFEVTWHKVFGEVFRRLHEDHGVSYETIEILMSESGYTHEGFMPESLLQYAATSMIAQKWIEIMDGEGQNPCGLSDAIIIELVDNVAISENTPIQLCEGVDRLLEYLSSKGYILGVATADTESSTIRSLEKAGILRYFSYIGADGKGLLPKPNPAIAQDFCQKNDFLPSVVLTVGDSLTDMLLAENAGTHFAGIKTRYNNYERFSEQGHSVVAHIEDIIEIFNL